jgi:hypothetical protein
MNLGGSMAGFYTPARYDSHTALPQTVRGLAVLPLTPRLTSAQVQDVMSRQIAQDAERRVLPRPESAGLGLPWLLIGGLAVAGFVGYLIWS